MKKINLILCSLLFASLLFGQSSTSCKSTKSSISVSEGENSYSLEASFSEGLKEEVKEAVMDFLGKENAKAVRNGWQWEKYMGDDLAYRFRIKENSCEINLEQRFLEEVEYEDLIDFCGRVKDLMGGEKSPAISIDEEGTTISVQGDLDLDLSGRPVKMKVNDEVFSLNASYKSEKQAQVERKIISVLGTPNVENKNQREWRKKSNGVLLYQFIIKSKRCEIFIDKTKMNEEEGMKLQNLGFAVAGKVL